MSTASRVLILQQNSSTFTACDVTYVPVLLIGYISAVGLKPPWDSPNKVNWMHTDLARWCRELNIPWKQGLPASYPIESTTMKVQRALVACSLECPAQYPNVLGELYHAFWYEKEAVQLPEIHRPIMAKVLGEELATKVMERSLTDEVKSLLKKNTSTAIGAGSPGIPWIRVLNLEGKEEFFWGFDHLGQVATFLGLKKLSESHL